MWGATGYEAEFDDGRRLPDRRQRREHSAGGQSVLQAAPIQSQVGPVMGREMQHWCLVVDLMLRGRPAAALDVDSQRIKSLEQIAKGVQSDIARRLELVGPEKVSLVTTHEASEAGKEVLQEERIQYRNSRGRTWEWQSDRDWPRGGKGKDKDKGKRDKGKADGKGKSDRDKGKGKWKREEEKDK